jgi:hypothetical protein
MPPLLLVMTALPAMLVSAIGFAQVKIVKKVGAIELATDQPLEHVLYLVSLGEPTPAMRSVIDAARTVATEKLHLTTQ